jgi:hypothetical protein
MRGKSRQIPWWAALGALARTTSRRGALPLALAACALACGGRAVESPSPGEIVRRGAWLDGQGALENDATRVVAVVSNRRGEFLLSRCARPPGTRAIIGGLGVATGGEGLIGPAQVRTLLETLKAGSGLSDLGSVQSRLLTVDHAGLMNLGPHGAFPHVTVRQVEQYQPMEIVRQTGTVLPASQRRLFALWLTTPGGARSPEEPARAAALRLVAQKAGPPAERLKQEFACFDEETRTAYFRFGYRGHPEDQFLLNDPATWRGEPYSAGSVWKGIDEPEMRLLAVYEQIIDGLGAEKTAQLFQRKLRK